MKRLIEFEIDGGSIFVEADEVSLEKSGRVQRGRSSGDEGDGRAQRFVEAVEKVRPAAEAVLKAFQEMHTPDEIGLEFGIKFSAKAGAILASVDSEATFKVSLKWTNKERSK
jgi:NTP-dependent ternary system trypsin peptidase co-occuring protein